MIQTADLKAMVGTVVEVCWNDAYSIDPWTFLSELEMDPLECQSYGMLIGVTKDNVAVSCTVNAGGHVAGTMVIPRGMIYSVKTIKEKELEDAKE